MRETKYFCDFCRKEIISYEDPYTIEISNYHATLQYNYDICKKCIDKILKLHGNINNDQM